ncbi:MAG: glycosyltransferase [Phycisphaerales bacterium]
MRIVHYLQRIDLAEGGVVRAVLDMTALLARRGHEVVLITHYDADAPDAWKLGEPGCPALKVVPGPARPLGLFAATQLQELEPTIKSADVVHLHACWTTANNQLASMARRLGVPYVLSIHGMLDDWCMAQKAPKKRVYLALAGRKTLEHAAFVHSTAQAELDQSKKWYPKGRGVVVPLVFDLDPFRTLPGPSLAYKKFGPDGSGDIHPDEPVVLFLSRVHPKKGVEHLIRAAALLRDRDIPCRTLIAGTGDEAYAASLRRLIEQHALADHVRLLGLVTGELKISLFERADVFALPTSQENFGFVLPEAMACRTPAITTRGVDIWPELESSGGALIADQSPEAFADAIALLLHDDARRTRMGDAGRAWVFEHLDPDAIAARFEGMYAQATGATQEAHA